MSQENVNLIYRWYEAFRAHDNEACVRDSAADVFAVFPDWHARVVRTIERGDAVVAEIRMAGRGAGSGLEVERPPGRSPGSVTASWPASRPTATGRRRSRQ